MLQLIDTSIWILIKNILPSKLNATFPLFDMVAGRKGISYSVNKKRHLSVSPSWVLPKISLDWCVLPRILIDLFG